MVLRTKVVAAETFRAGRLKQRELGAVCLLIQLDLALFHKDHNACRSDRFGATCPVHRLYMYEKREDQRGWRLGSEGEPHCGICHRVIVAQAALIPGVGSHVGYIIPFAYIIVPCLSMS